MCHSKQNRRELAGSTAVIKSNSGLNYAHIFAARESATQKISLNARQARAIRALQNSPWVTREQIDRIAGASNGPAVIAALRKKFGHDAIEMRRVDAFDRDGAPCKPGQYRLSCIGRKRVQEILEAHS